MEGLNVAQAVVTTAAVTLILTPLLVLSFLAGRRSKSQGRIQRLDQLQPEVSLGGSVWRTEVDDDADPANSQTYQLEMEQIGSRILARGHSADGTRHSLEGVIHHGHLCGVSIDETRQDVWLGTVTVELLPGQQQMTGMRSRWSPRSQTLTVRKITFVRLGAGHATH